MKLSLSWLVFRYHRHKNICDRFAKNTRIPNPEFSIVRFTQAFLMNTMTTAVKLYKRSRRTQKFAEEIVVTEVSQHISSTLLRIFADNAF
jgi:hypothetical protein